MLLPTVFSSGMDWQFSFINANETGLVINCSNTPTGKYTNDCLSHDRFQISWHKRRTCIYVKKNISMTCLRIIVREKNMK